MKTRFRGTRHGGYMLIRSLALLVVGGLLGGLIATYSGASAHQIRAGAATGSTPRTASSRSAAGARNSSSEVPVPTSEKLREQAIAIVSPAVVEVKNVGIGLGSGVLIKTASNNGYIVTNNHVVANAHQIEVALPNGKTIGARITGTDPVDDLAVVRIDTRQMTNSKKIPVASLGNSSDLRVGQTVLAIGNPLGIVNTVTDGIVSALHRTVSEGQGSGSILSAVQTSAAINPGNSGGALINLAGQVIGIPTLTAIDPEFGSPASGVGFAIPSNTVQNIVSQLIQYHMVKHSGRAALGIKAVSVTSQLAQEYGLPVDHGVLIGGFATNSPAQQAGLKANEIIVKVDSTNINTEEDLLTYLASKSPGNTITVTVVDPQRHQHSVKVKLGELNVNGNG